MDSRVRMQHARSMYSGSSAAGMLQDREEFPQAVSVASLSVSHLAVSESESLFGPFGGVGVGAVSSPVGVKKKKKKRRVVEDIEVIGAEFEEKERILAERKARSERQVDEEPPAPTESLEPAHTQDARVPTQPVNTTPAPKSQVVAPASRREFDEALASPTTVSALVTPEPAAAPTPTAPTEETHKADEATTDTNIVQAAPSVPTRSRHSLSSLLHHSDLPTVPLAESAAVAIPAPHTRDSSQRPTPTQSPSASYKPRSIFEDAATNPSSELTATPIEQSAEPDSVADAITQADNSSSTRHSRANSRQVDDVTLVSAPEPISNEIPPIVAEPFVEPVLPTPAATPAAAAAVTAAPTRTSLSQEEVIEPAQDLSVSAPPRDRTPSVMSSSLSQAMEARAAAQPKTTLRSAPASQGAANPPPAISTSAGRTAGRPQSQQVLLESTDEYDVYLNQLASSPAESVMIAGSPQLRALVGARLGASASFLSRPQLASLGLAYVSDYFDESKTGQGAADSAPATPGLGPGHATTQPMRIGIGARAQSVDETDFPSSSPPSEGQHIKTLIRPVSRESPRDLMKRQEARCAGCSTSIFMGVFSSPRYCHYTGALYCATCHVNDKRALPGEVLVNGDCTKYKVCTLATAYLDTIYSIPSIPMAAISPHLYQTCRDLGHVFVLRQQLAHMRAFILTCRKKSALLKLLGQRQYMLNDTLVRASGDAAPPKTAPPPQPAMMAQSVTSDDMPTVGIGSYFPKQSLLQMHSPAKVKPGSPVTPDGPAAVASPADPSTPTAASSSTFARSSRSRVPAMPDSSSSDTAAAAAAAAAATASEQPHRYDPYDPQVDDPALDPSLSDMYSLRDLVEILTGSLSSRLTQVVRQLQAHIVGGRCEICSSKAFFCEVEGCHDKETCIYSFQLATVVQCGQCAQAFHRSCFDRDNCPKCARIAARKAAAAMRLASAKAGALTRMGSGNFSLSSSPANGAGFLTGGGGGGGTSSRLSSSPMNISSALQTSVGGGGGRLGFAPTGAGSLRGEVGMTVDRTRSGVRSSSPMRQMGERFTSKNRSASPAPM